MRRGKEAREPRGSIHGMSGSQTSAMGLRKRYQTETVEWEKCSLATNRTHRHRNQTH